MLRHATRLNSPVESIGKPIDHLGPLPRAQSRRRAACEHEIPVQIDNQGIGGGIEQRLALGGNAEDVRAGLLHQVLNMARMHDGYVQAAPLVDAHAEAHRLGRNGQHGEMVADEDDAAGWGHGGLDHADDVGD